MSLHLSWQFDEFQPPGRDYGSREEVAVYDSSHSDFRDLDAESEAVLDELSIRPGDVLVDFGSGTGTLAIRAARRGAEVHAIDVSAEMIREAKRKATERGVEGIRFHHAGFLTYEHPDETVDLITTTFAFHHLPDFWKGIALKRMNRMLKTGGRLYMHDVILEEDAALEKIAAFIRRQETAGGDFLREDAEGHFRDEFSTYDWVLEGLLSRAGFAIESKRSEGGVIGTYLCRKEAPGP